ncbi:hypothetical protein FRC10_005835, partial [Ceratobasidium sp. 414]
MILDRLPLPWPVQIPQLCDLILESTHPSQARIDSITCYKEPKGVHHEFLVVKVLLSSQQYKWIRLDRAAKPRNNKIRILGYSSSLPADDTAIINSSDNIVDGGEEIQRLDLATQCTSLHVLANLLNIFSSEAPWYTATQ